MAVIEAASYLEKPSGIDVLTSVRDQDRDLVKTSGSVWDRDGDQSPKLWTQKARLILS
jgi:hypothetical protein